MPETIERAKRVALLAEAERLRGLLRREQQERHAMLGRLDAVLAAAPQEEIEGANMQANPSVSTSLMGKSRTSKKCKALHDAAEIEATERKRREVAPEMLNG